MKNYYYLTTYQNHYVRKPIKLQKPTPQGQEFADPISEGHKHYLFLDKSGVNPPKENGNDYFEMFKEKYKDRKLVLLDNRPLQTDLIIRSKMKDLESEYRARYCEQITEKKKVENGKLPDDAYIPLTTQRACYKPPLEYTPKAYEPPVVRIPPNNIGEADERLHDILGVKTGITEYMDRIGSLGEYLTRTGWEQSRK